MTIMVQNLKYNKSQ